MKTTTLSNEPDHPIVRMPQFIWYQACDEDAQEIVLKLEEDKAYEWVMNSQDITTTLTITRKIVKDPST